MDELERILHDARPQAREPFVDAVASRLDAPRRATRALRSVVAIGFTVAVTAALALAGAYSSVAAATSRAADVVRRAVAAPAKHPQRPVVRRVSSGGDQYQPGFGFGDPNHNHDGPPGIKPKERDTNGDGVPDAPAPLAAPKPKDAVASVVATTVAFDEQVHLYISVIDRSGEPLLLTQRSKRGGSTVGTPLNGPQTKFIQYAVLVPRPLELKLRIPSNLLKPNERYRVRIVAIDPQGNKSTVYLPFTQPA